MPRGPVLSTPTPDHSGTDEDRKGGPLWLRLQGYVLPLLLCQDHLRVLTTGALVTTRTGFPPQVRPGIFRHGGGRTGASGGSCAASSGGRQPCPDCRTVARRRSTVWVVRFCGSAVRVTSGSLAMPGSSRAGRCGHVRVAA